VIDVVFIFPESTSLRGKEGRMGLGRQDLCLAVTAVGFAVGGIMLMCPYKPSRLKKTSKVVGLMFSCIIF
jgi:hypothetical protein